jgi:hypothetical protein
VPGYPRWWGADRRRLGDGVRPACARRPLAGFDPDVRGAVGLGWAVAGAGRGDGGSRCSCGPGWRGPRSGRAGCAGGRRGGRGGSRAAGAGAGRRRGWRVSRLPDGVVTFVFSDIEGLTRLVKVLRDRYPQVLAEHRRLVRAAVAAHGGREVDTAGDGFFVVFGGATQAVVCALEVQRALRTPLRHHRAPRRCHHGLGCPGNPLSARRVQVLGLGCAPRGRPAPGPAGARR